jgi:hypothetical protein
MSVRWVRLFCLYAVTFLLAAQATAQVRVDAPRKTNHDIRCSIQVDPVWRPTAPVLLRGKIENLTFGPLVVDVIPILYLSSKTSKAERDKYWGPVDLLRDGPLGLDKKPMDKKGEVLAIKALPLNLVFASTVQSINFSIDVRHVLWDREISSVWPSRELFAAIEPGAYDLRLVLETDTGDSNSETVAVQVGEDQPHTLKH